MSEFKISEAAFAGYGIIRKKPGLLLALTLFCVIANFVGYAIILNTSGPALAQMAELRKSGQMAGADPAMAMDLLRSSIVLYAIAAVMGALSYMVSAGAVARAVIRPSTSKPPYVGLGADEFRLLAVGLVVGVILFLVTMAGSIVIGIASLGTMMASGDLKTLTENPGTQPASMMAVAYVGSGVVYILVFLLSVRFSLAPAQSEKEEAIRIFGSWGLTKGRYWPTTWAYVLALLSLVPLYAIGAVINVGVSVAMGANLDDGIMAMMQPDWASESVFTPSILVYVLVNSILVAIAWIVCLASSATVYAKVEGIALGAHNVFSDDEDGDEG